MDRYTKTVLTLIAVALTALVLRGELVHSARADSPTVCRIDGPIEVRVRELPGPLEVRVREFPEVKLGSWSGQPFYVKEAK